MPPSRISFNTTSGKQPGSACLLQDLVISRPARRTPMPMLLDELRVGQSLASVTPTVDPPTQQSQSMTFPALPVQSYGDSDFALTATASSNLSVSYVSGNTGVATVSGNTVHIVAPGTTSITANQSENSEYLLAPDASQTLTVNKASQSIIFSAFGAKTFGDANHTLSGSTNSGLVDVTRSPNMNNKCFPSSQSRRLKSLFSGFTLIELLVVIAIIGVLAAIALPIFGAVQKRAQNVQDISNMRQLALLASQYSTENNGAFVPGKGYDDPVTKTGTQQWQVLLARLYVPKNIAGIWELPDFTTTPAKLKKEYAIFSPPWHKLTDKFWQTGYGINMDIGLPENTKTNTAESWGQIYSAINVTELTKRPLIFSWPEWNAYSSYSSATFKQALGPTKKINILFCDYHVGTIDEKDEAKFKAMIKNPASI